MECGLAVCYPLKNDRSYVLKNNGDQLLGQVHYLTPSQVCLNESINQDTLIRGILFGWGNLRNGNFWCPLWEIIYQIDTSLFSQTGFLTRICMLRTIHFLLQVWIQAMKGNTLIMTYIYAVFHANLWLSGYSNLVSTSVCQSLGINVILLTNVADRPSQLMFHHDISADYFAWYGFSLLDAA